MMKFLKNICLFFIIIGTFLSILFQCGEASPEKMTRIQHVFRGLLGEGPQGDITTRGRRYGSEPSSYFLPRDTNQILEEPWQSPSERTLQYK
ncbi:Hypothetical protein SRAE_1000112900 [Strongyloides ratti]|uniref:Uncharacterized protein n=1 Tax=Strongyloides ratti TaxID=34506 RepID=A0A090L425_STRRB|nr:Hypothetical protein SRAE_1000112900 [Strongyloides ratti]CEF62862.1 Hypothetical protein SRAE_1000112900 [Strongyloides ratti]